MARLEFCTGRRGGGERKKVRMKNRDAFEVIVVLVG